VALEPSECLCDLGPRVRATVVGEAPEHLVQRAERLLLEAHAVRRRVESKRRGHLPRLDRTEPGALVGVLDDAGLTEAERTRLPSRIPAMSSMASVAGPSQRSITSPQRSHAAAASCHCSRVVSL